MKLNEHIGTSGRAVQGTNFTLAYHDSVTRLSWWGPGGGLEYFLFLLSFLEKAFCILLAERVSRIFLSFFLFSFSLYFFLSLFYFFFLCIIILIIYVSLR